MIMLHEDCGSLLSPLVCYYLYKHWHGFPSKPSFLCLLVSRLTAGHHPHLRQHDLNDNAAMKKLDAGMESQAADLTAH